MKICFAGRKKLSFVEQDYRLLKKNFDVKFINPPTNIRESLKFPFNVSKQLKECDLTFFWFAANYYSAILVYLAKKYRKKSIVVIGGFDVANEMEINYGAFTDYRKIFANYVLKNANILLPVSGFTKKEVLKRITGKKIIRIYNGIDTEKFCSTGKKENIVTTIGDLDNKKLKGIDTFLQVSKFFQEYKFVIIGKKIEDLEKKIQDKSENIICTGRIPHDMVVEWLKRTSIYCQLSYRESFGCGVAEAMSCGCIPVVTNRGALREIVGNTGFYVPYGDVKASADAIKKALEAPDELRKKARERIKKYFSVDKRENKLVNVIDTEFGLGKE